MTPEGKVKNEVKKLLDYYACYYFMPVQFGYGKRTLDFLVCHQGKFLAIEAKAPGEELTKQQKDIAIHIIAADGYVAEVDGEKGLVELEKWLEENAK